MIIIISFFSFILEYLFNYLLKKTLFLPLITLTTTVIVRPFFKKNNNLFYTFCFILGILYDLIYTGNFFLSAGIYLIIGIIINLISTNMPNNIFTSIFKIICAVIIYRTLCFLFFYINGITIFSISNLFKSIYSSLLLNIIYGTLIYLILYLLSKKFNIKRID